MSEDRFIAKNESLEGITEWNRFIDFFARMKKQTLYLFNIRVEHFAIDNKIHEKIK